MTFNKLFLCILTCLLFSSCIHKENADISINNNEIIKTDSSNDYTNKINIKATEVSTSEKSTESMLPKEIQAFTDMFLCNLQIDDNEYYQMIDTLKSDISVKYNSFSYEKSFDIDSFTNAVDEFNWVSFDNKPCLTANMFANECRVFISDINSDSTPEILLTDIYSPREANYTEVFSFTDGSLKSDGGFWGYVFSENEKTQIYINSANKSVFISDTETTHGGKTVHTVSEVTVSELDETFKFITVSSDNNSEAEYYQCDIEAEITRDFLDGGFDSKNLIKLTKEEYEQEFSAYIDSLTEQYAVLSTDCGFLSIGNYPTSEMLSDPDFDYSYYIKHKDEPHSIKAANQKTSDSIKQKLILLYGNKS